MDKSDFIVLYPKQSFVDICHEEAKKLGCLNNSIRHGDGNLSGFMGERAVILRLKFTKTNDTSDNSKYHFDMIDTRNYKLDVKTKPTNYEPELNYAATVSDLNIYQECQYYLFVRTHSNLKKIWILGWLEKLEFYRLVEFNVKGYKDLKDLYFEAFSEDCWNVLISDLHPISELGVMKEDHSDWLKVKKEIFDITEKRRNKLNSLIDLEIKRGYENKVIILNQMLERGGIERYERSIKK